MGIGLRPGGRSPVRVRVNQLGKLWQHVESLPQQPLPSWEWLHAIASLPQQDLSPLPQQPLPSLAHCLASLPEQQFIADLWSLSFLQQAMSLPWQPDMPLPTSA